MIVGVFLFVLSNVCESHNIFRRSAGRRYCGKLLTQTLEMLCTGRGYNGLSKSLGRNY